AHPWRALSDRRGFPGGTRRHASGERHRARLRPPGHAGERGAAHRAGAVDAGDASTLTRARFRGSGSPMMSIIRTPRALLAAGLAPPARLGALERVAARYAVTITPAMADLIDRDSTDDPIARQF